MRKHVPVICLTLLALALASPAEAQLGFGRAVAAVEGEILIGEPANQVGPGIVYVYRPGSGGWVEFQRLTRSDSSAGDGFGASLAVAGERVLVGATEAGAGVAYVFELRGRSWVEVGRVAPDDGTEGDQFGGSMVAEGGIMAVGAPQHEDGIGAVYLYRRGDVGWELLSKLRPEDVPDEGDDEGAAPSNFGSSVTLREDWLLVGAPGGGTNPGRVHMFRSRGNAWQPVGSLAAPESEAGDAFGFTMSSGDGELMIGSPGVNDGAGAVYAYRFDEPAGEWAQHGTLVPYDAPAGSRFGTALVFDNDEAFVGAPGANGGTGDVYHFRRDGTGNWTNASKIGAVGLLGSSQMGASLAAWGDVVAAGMPGDDYSAGTAVIMSRGLGGWDRTRVLSEEARLETLIGETIECVDGMAAIFPCDNVDLVAFMPIHELGGSRGVGVNDMWGWADPDTGREYAVVGMGDRTSFVDVTDPYAPVWVGSLEKTAGANSALWRDVKIYGDHVFIVADGAGAHGVQIFDLAHLREFEGEPLAFTEDAHYDRIHSAHNIVIDEGTPYAYVVGASGGGETCGGGLHMINVEDPQQPVFEGCFADTNTGRGTGYTHDAQCIIYSGPDERYAGREICIGSNATAVSIADVTDKRNPVAVSIATYPNIGYTHQGGVSEDHRYFYLNDELDEINGLTPGARTMIFDISELDDPILVGEYVAETTGTDHNLYVLGDVIYQSVLRSGLRVYDISDRESMRPIGFFDTVPWGDDGGFGVAGVTSVGAWSNYPYFKSGVVAVSSQREGLFLLRLKGTDDSP